MAQTQHLMIISVIKVVTGRVMLISSIQVEFKTVCVSARFMVNPPYMNYWRHPQEHPHENW
jgi:hypothetical protein